MKLSFVCLAVVFATLMFVDQVQETGAATVAKPHAAAPKPKAPAPKPKAPAPRPKAPAPKPKAPAPRPKAPAPKPHVVPKAPPKPKAPTKPKTPTKPHTPTHPKTPTNPKTPTKPHTHTNPKTPTKPHTPTHHTDPKKHEDPKKHPDPKNHPDPTHHTDPKKHPEPKKHHDISMKHDPKKHQNIQKFDKFVHKFGDRALKFLGCMGSKWMDHCVEPTLTCALVHDPVDCTRLIVCEGMDGVACSIHLAKTIAKEDAKENAKHKAHNPKSPTKPNTPTHHADPKHPDPKHPAPKKPHESKPHNGFEAFGKFLQHVGDNGVQFLKCMGPKFMDHCVEPTTDCAGKIAGGGFKKNPKKILDTIGECGGMLTCAGDDFHKCSKHLK